MKIVVVPIDLVTPHPALRHLSLLRPSLKELDLYRRQGVTKPPIVRPIDGDGQRRYQLLAGVTTWVAAPLLGLHELEVVVIDVDDETAAEVVEQNQGGMTVQNPIKKARALVEALERHPGLTQRELAQMIGEKHYNLSHYMRLLNLPEAVQEMVETGQLKYGHARALLALDSSSEQLALAKEAVKRGLSARVVESAVKKMAIDGGTVWEVVGESLTQRSATVVAEPKAVKKDREIVRLEQRLSEILGTAVEIEFLANGSGSMRIAYANLDILEGVIQRIEGQVDDF